jgi:prolipoprotein diacylglyceryltransferase
MAAITYDPIPIWDIGPLALSLHGVFAGLGVVAGGTLMVRDSERRGFGRDITISIFTWGVVAAIIGTRLFTIPAHLGDPGYGFDDMIAIAGDYSILGGYVGGIIGALIRFRMLRAPGLPFLDMVAPGMALGAVIGRIGDLAIVEHLGSPTDFFLGYTIKPGYDVSPQHDALECTVQSAVDGICGTYHHTALYDLLGALVLLGLLLYLRKAWSGKHYGQLFWIWAAWYGFQRFLIDFARLGAAQDGTVADSVMGPFTGSQWGALALGAAGVALFVWAGRTQPPVSAEQDAAYVSSIPFLVENPPEEVAAGPAESAEVAAVDGDEPAPD